ncbi:MAG: hypothetical protein ACRDO4_12075 [Nocardioides sp.]
MMSRIPLIAAVVGALLVGGATTEVTRASWTDQRQLHAHGATAGSMSFTATSPGAVSVDKMSTSAAETSIVLDDTSAGKNLQQRITATIATTPAGITATVGTDCTTTGPSASVDTIPTSPDQTLCMKVTSSTTAVSGTVTINLLGAQQPTGWSTPLLTRSFPVTVNAVATPPPVPASFRCTGFDNNNIVRFAWDAVPTAEKYRVYRSGSSTFVEATAPATTLAANRNTWAIANGVPATFLVKSFASAGGESSASNTVSVTFGSDRTCSPQVMP